MDPTTPDDTLGRRFSSFWLGIFLFVAFALAALVVVPFVRDPGGDPTLDSGDLAARRAETLATVRAADSEAVRTYALADKEKNLAQVPVERVIALAAKRLSETTPTPSDKVIPGTATATAIFEKQMEDAQKAAPSKPADGTTPDQPQPDQPQPDQPQPDPAPQTAHDPAVAAALREKGKAVYNGHGLCFTCHQPNGNGLPPAFPPLAESGWTTGSDERIVAIILRGMQGPIEVKGQTFVGAMPPQATLSDDDIAAVVTYIRSEWGNDAPPVLPAQVAAVREKYKPEQGMWTVPQLMSAIPEGQMLPPAGE